MAKQRVQVADLPGPVAVTPQAEQVNVFHNPLTPLPAEDNSALQLARGLAVLRPSLYQAADIAVDKETKQGEAAALLADRTENRDKITGAVKAGALPAGASPWFQKGWNRQKNRILADQYATDLQTAYAQWHGKDSDNPEEADVQSFMQGHLDGFLKSRNVDQSDPEFTNVFSSMAAQIQSRQNAEFGAHRVNRIEKQVVENTATEISGILDLPYVYGGAENQAKVISATLAEHVKNGADGSTLNRVAVDAITQKAIASGDTSVLNQLDLIDTGNGRIGRTLYAREERLKAENSIYSSRHSTQSQEWATSEQSKKLAGEAIHAEAIKRLLQDPSDNLTDLIDSTADTDPDTAGKLLSLRSAMIGMKQSSRPDLEAEAADLAAIYRGEIMHEDLGKLISDPNRSFSTEQVKDYTIAIEKAEQQSEHGGILRDPLYNDTQSAIRKAIRGADIFHDNPERDLQAVKAEAFFAQSMIRFAAQNPPPTPEKIQNEMFRLEEVAVNRYTDKKMVKQTFTLDPLETAGQPAPATKPAASKPTAREPGEH